ncbi:death ligand signal enhancer isoform 2-T2 [Discoglossus pictus]
MWRLPGLLSRVLNRFHAANVPGYVEAEALNPSSLLPLGQNAGAKSSTFNSSGSQYRQNDQDQKKKGTFQSCRIPQCTFMDAFGWGAVAVFFLQLARHVSNGSAHNSTREDRSPRRYFLNQITSLAQNQNFSVRTHVLPKGAKACGWNGITLEPDPSPHAVETSPESLYASSSLGHGVLQLSNEQGESQTGNTNSLSASSSTSESVTDSEDSAARFGQEEPEGELEESLQLAASRLLDVTESSVPVVLNIFGIVSARDNADYRTAFRCFQESAESGYSKAQYNTGVCYEQGRGVAKDMEKAAEYYLLAANSGHPRAQYRYARYLLQSQAESKPEDTQRALRMLKEAAHAGIMEAQAYLGVLYSRDVALDPQKAVSYLWMAAENGDAKSRYYLGVCYEKGFGVPVSRWEARRHYERSAKNGHRQAQQKLQEMQEEQAEGQDSHSFSLRGTASSPCLPVLERSSILTRAGNTYTAKTDSLGLPHSMSAGNLLLMSTDSRSCNLLPVHMTSGSLPLTSLRAIGVG